MSDRNAVAPTVLGWRVAGDLSVPELRDLLRGRVPITAVDLTYMAEYAVELGAVALDEASRVADTGAAPRIAVIRLGEEDHILLVTTHHPITAAAGRVFVADLLAYYARRGSEFLSTYTTELGGLARAGMSTDHLRTATRDRRSGTVTVDADVDAIETWCRHRSCTLPDALLAGAFLLLARHSAKYELSIAVDAWPVTPGSPVARVVRLDWSETGTTGHLVDRVREADSTPDGPCDARFIFLDKRDPAQVAGFTVTPFEVSTGHTADDLTIIVSRHASGVRLRVDNDRDLFDSSTVQRLAERLTNLWNALPDEPSLGDLTATTTAERQALLTTWQGPTDPYAGRCLHELIELHAMLSPDRPAVVAGDRRITYQELDQWANRAAHVLRDHAVRPESVIGVVAERSVESVVAMLAVLKAGGCYVPIDPNYPAQRLRYLLSDSGSRVLLGAGLSLTELPPLDPHMWIVDLCSDTVQSADSTAVLPLARPDNLAYVIYTSGSTGVPKPVAVSHRSIVCSTHARRVGGVGPTVDLVTMPLSFDGSAGGLYWALTTGGTALLPTEREIHDPHLLAALVASTRVTHIHSVPSTYSVLLEAAEAVDLAELALVSVGGEPLPPGLVARHRDLCPDSKLLNDYGPTEGTVWATAHVCRAEDAAARLVPIGQPLPNYRAYVLDDGLRCVPPGVPGELYLGGDGVARGYLGRPGLSAARFVPDPYGKPGGRLYRTGDRARHIEDGTLQILGRLDGQVKVRGFRVELGEIESVLCRYPEITEAVVLLDESNPRNPMLVAHVAPSTVKRKLTNWLVEQLPTYMVPDRLVCWEKLPRNRNGKLDSSVLRGAPERTA